MKIDFINKNIFWNMRISYQLLWRIDSVAQQIFIEDMKQCTRALAYSIFIN